MPWSQTTITSAHLVLRPFAATDADEAFPCITPTLTRYMSFDPAASKEEFESIWRGWLGKIDAGVDFVFAIRHADTGSFIGLAGLHRADETEPELGIWIRESEHGHGYGLEAVHAVAAWGATTFRPGAFIYPVALENRPSRRIAESLRGEVFERRTWPKYDLVVYRIPALAQSTSQPAAPCGK